MPFMGMDWRAPGERWVRTQEGWERLKLRPLQPTGSEPCFRQAATTTRRPASLAVDVPTTAPTPRSPARSLPSVGVAASSPLFSAPVYSDAESDDDVCNGGLQSGSDEDELQSWQPHCFVKTGKSKEFVGCTSMSEAFLQLNFARAVTSVRRLNYICKVVQILVQNKLSNLSASARKVLLSIVEAIVVHSLETYSDVGTARDLVDEFLAGLNEGQHCGSPQLLCRHQDAATGLYELLESRQPSTPAESAEEGVTFLDLPRECLRAVLSRLPDHRGLLEAAKAHEALRSLVETERRLWSGLCAFHFSPSQLTVVREKMGAPAADDERAADFDWRHAFFELKKYFGLREVYADMIFICCHCKALFWKVRQGASPKQRRVAVKCQELGHPCVSPSAPSVRVTPLQFVDMLRLL